MRPHMFFKLVILLLVIVERRQRQRGIANTNKNLKEIKEVVPENKETEKNYNMEKTEDSTKTVQANSANALESRRLLFCALVLQVKKIMTMLRSQYISL